MTACNNMSTALMQSISKKGTQSSMKTHKKALHEIPTNITPTPAKGRNDIYTDEHTT
jgi:hypothetical protein